ncbi:MULTISPECIES: hypothetical protein [Vitreoscilla]|uniref:Uncharacterized protein n=1 Tax=Vitreoscilla stercoraria TaxID=61 RepID=A0ABY4E975_VITST|nr:MULTISPECIES: hypothetical protein [Vitreoscilla]AUZ06428.2 hypothetical protein ADP71_32610 [Vitreoscilla sp. C1]UOO92291.1 hypothetical protein LVJ81_11860 [Vitreoscilla stercoraria]
MQTLKLVVSLGGLSVSAAQNLQVADNPISMINAHACKAILITDEVRYQPPIISQVSDLKIIDIPKISVADTIFDSKQLKMRGAARRLLRKHFWQHQALFWSSFDAELAPYSDQHAVSVVLLVDTTNMLASSICWDVLCQIRLHYPHIRCYLVFLVSQNPQSLNEFEKLNVAALLSEYNGIGQKAWLPCNLDSQTPYAVENIPLWEASFLHELPHKSDVAFDYAPLIEQVVSLPQQKLGMDTFEHLLKEDFPKLSDINKKVMLPRVISLLKASLQMDMTAAQKMMTQTIQVQLLGLLLQPSRVKKSVLQTNDGWLQAGWILDEKSLLLNASLDAGSSAKHESIEKEWQVRGDFFVQQVQDMKKLSWKEKADELYVLFQKAYDKYFREAGVEQYYSLSQSRLERLLEAQGKVIESKIWSQCFHGEYDLNQLAMQIPEALSYYILLQEKFELQQRRMREEYLIQQSLWQEKMDAWQNSSRRERGRMEQIPMLELGELLKTQYVLQSHYKAFSFAIKLIDTLMPCYQNILNSVDGIKKLWLKQEQTQSEVLSQLEIDSQNVWVTKNYKNGVHQYLLQPTSSTAQHLLREFIVDLNDWVPEMQSTWTRRVGEQGDFTQLFAWMKQGQWLTLVERIAAQISYRLSMQTPQSGVSPLSLMFEQRLTDLTQLQVQQLSKHIIDSMTRGYKTQWEPLGKVLSEHYQSRSSAAILCSLDLQNPEAQTVVLWMKEIAKRVNPNVAVVPTEVEQQIQMVMMHTGYLQEWMGLYQYQSVYQQHVQHDDVLEWIHIDGLAAKLRHISLQFGQRNLDLVRQQLLLAKISGHLVRKNDGFELFVNLAGGLKRHTFVTDDLAYLTETIPLRLVKALIDQNRVLREENVQDEITVWNQKLDDILSEMRALYVPEGMDLADMDWKDAGKYVVWTRSVQNLRKYWLLPPESMDNTANAILN